MQWAKDYAEVKEDGREDRFGAHGGADRDRSLLELVGPATYNPVARQLSEAKGLDVVDNARLFALFSIAASDAGVAIFEAKYKYNFWRPVTAIRNGDLDGNDATERDPTWEPFVRTPMHPEYPCAHCTFRSPAASVLRTFFGSDAAAFKLKSAPAPGVTHSLSKLSDYVARSSTRVSTTAYTTHGRRSRRSDGPQDRRVHGPKLSKTRARI